jgi:hypothetical protein
VARLHEVIEEPLPDLVCLHVPTVLIVRFTLRLFDRTTVPVWLDRAEKSNELARCGVPISR